MNSKMDKSNNFLFEYFPIFRISIAFRIKKILEICYFYSLRNSKNKKFKQFQKFLYLTNFGNDEIFEIVLTNDELTNFQNLTILKIKKC